MPEFEITYSEVTVYTTRIEADSQEQANEDFQTRFCEDRDSLDEVFSHAEDLNVFDISKVGENK